MRGGGCRRERRKAILWACVTDGGHVLLVPQVCMDGNGGLLCIDVR